MDRCFTTITQALSIKLGGSANGPAGTGKTQTIKELANNLGMYSINYNCSD